MAVYSSITDLIGNTPMVKLQRMAANLSAEVFIKLEYFNPMSSVKDRVGREIILQAERDGVLQPGGTIVEATSGNTGLALALVGSVRGYRVVIVMPDSMSMERRRLLIALGAELVLTPGEGGMKAALAKAEEIVEQTPGAILAGQFSNPANPAAHQRTTAKEIWQDMSGRVDALVFGVGSGGTITGVGREIRALNPDVRVVAVEPADSAVLSGKKAGPHGIQGIGAGFVPAILDTSLFDEIIPVASEDARQTARLLSRNEGIFGGISTGANVWAAMQLASRAEFAGKRIVTLACDTGERYLSTDLYSDAAEEGGTHG